MKHKPIQFKIKNDQAHAFRGNKKIAYIQFDMGREGLHVTWADSWEKGAATLLLCHLIEKRKPKKILIVPVTWNGVHWAAKLIRERERLNLPKIKWEFFGDVGFEWYDNDDGDDWPSRVTIENAVYGTVGIDYETV